MPLVVIALLLVILNLHDCEFLNAGAVDVELAPPIPLHERPQADPSVTGYTVNFTQGGQLSRYPPRFINDARDKSRRQPGFCEKPQELVNKHKKNLNKTCGLLNITCLSAQVNRAAIILQTPESRSHGIMALYCFAPYFVRLVSCDTGCQSASWAYSHLKRFFTFWKWLVDRFHHGGGKVHKCQKITQTSEFSAMTNINDSFVEQLHRAQRMLNVIVKSSSMARTIFLVALIDDHLYHETADRAHVPLERRQWPHADSVKEYVPDHVARVKHLLRVCGEVAENEVAQDQATLEVDEDTDDEDDAPTGQDADVGEDEDHDEAEDVEDEVDDEYEYADEGLIDLVANDDGGSGELPAEDAWDQDAAKVGGARYEFMVEEMKDFEDGTLLASHMPTLNAALAMAPGSSSDGQLDLFTLSEMKAIAKNMENANLVMFDNESLCLFTIHDGCRGYP